MGATQTERQCKRQTRKEQEHEMELFAEQERRGRCS